MSIFDRIVQGTADVGRALITGSSGPAVERSVTTNVNNTIETPDSGNQYPTMQGNPLTSITSPIFRNVIDKIAKNIPQIGTGVGVGVGTNLLLQGDANVCESPQAQPYSVNKMNGCVTVTRKQQARLKEMVGIIGLEATASAVGLDTNTLVLLLLKRFKARGRGITAASMRTTKRTIRQIKNLHAEVASMAGRRTTVRRGSTTKTSIVKA